MKLIIAGSRRFPKYGINEYRDWTRFNKNYFIDVVYGLLLDIYPQTTHVVSGGAWGIDKIAEDVAEIMGVPITIFPAKWENTSLGKRAGLARNVEMSVFGDALLSINSGSSGSKHMIECMKKLGKPYHEEIIK